MFTIPPYYNKKKGDQLAEEILSLQDEVCSREKREKDRKRERKRERERGGRG